MKSAVAAKIRLKAERLARELRRKRLSQNAWARRLGLSSSHLSMLLSGQRPFPTRRTRQKLLKGLDLEFDDLFEPDEEAPGRDGPEANAKRPLTERRTRDPLLEIHARGLVVKVEWESLAQEGDNVMSSIAHDFRYAWRGLRRSPGFSVVTVLLLALAIGANTSVFSIVSGVLLQPLPLPDSDQVVVIWENEDYAVAPLNYLDWKERATRFESMAAFDWENANLTGGAAPVRVRALRAGATFLDVLRLAPAAGRDFDPEETNSGADTVVILSHGLWKNYFGSDPDLVGSDIDVDGDAHEVVGILPPEFEFPGANRGSSFLVRPLAFTAHQLEPPQRGAHWIGVVARLGPFASVESAQDEMSAIAGQLAREYPDTNARYDRATVVPLREEFVGEFRRPLWLLLAAVGAVLVVACLNVAGLVAARSTSRLGDLAIRAALGASRARLAREYLTESLMLCLAGGSAGLLLAYWGTSLLLAMTPSEIPRISGVSIDGRVLLFTAAAGFLATAVVTLTPLVANRLKQLSRILRGSMPGTAVRVPVKFGNTIVAIQIALTMAVLVGATLLFGSFYNLQRVDPGFDYEHTLSFQLQLPLSDYDDAGRIRFFQELLNQAESLPGVTHAGAIMSLPLARTGDAGGTFSIEGREVGPDDEYPNAQLRPVTPGYFEAMGIPVLRGRTTTWSDDSDSSGGIVVNQALADKYFGDLNILGQRIRPHVSVAGSSRGADIVGIVGNVRHYELSREPVPEIYVPYPHQPVHLMGVVIRTRNSPRTLAGSVRDLIAARDPDLPVVGMATMEQVRSQSLAGARFRSLLMGVFATLGLVLAGLGLYGLMSYLVVSRTREFGMRMTLGAVPSDIWRMVVRRGFLLAVAGVLCGLPLTLWSSRYLEGLLFGISSGNQWTLAGLSAFLALVGIVASLIPAVRASRVDPISALRCP